MSTPSSPHITLRKFVELRYADHRLRISVATDIAFTVAFALLLGPHAGIVVGIVALLGQTVLTVAHYHVTLRQIIDVLATGSTSLPLTVKEAALLAKLKAGVDSAPPTA